jgi:hypothetical protein
MGSVRVVLALLLCACGRIGFDGSASTDAIERDSFGGLCAFDSHVVISDGIAADESTGVTLSARLAQGCAKAPAMRVVQQDDAGILDASGRPTIASSELACIGGGDGPNRAIAYLLAGDTPLTWTGTTPVTIRERATNRVIAMGDATPSHDYAFIMVVVDRIGGVYVLSAQGLATNGTRAAAYWFTNMMSPAIANDTRVWTVVEWTNADADPQPSPGDTFVVLGSG